MSLCLFLLFEEMMSMQFFWNIQMKADYPWDMQEFEIYHQMFVMMTQNIIKCNLNKDLFRTLSDIWDGVFLRKQSTV